MDEFAEALVYSESVETVLDEILDSLDVVVGGLLDLLHLQGVFDGETAVYVAKVVEQRLVETFQLGQGQVAQRDEIFDFYSYAIPYEGEFRKISAKGLSLQVITSVNRRDGCQWIQHVLSFCRMNCKFRIFIQD